MLDDAALENMAANIRAGKRRALAKAITLIENQRPDRRRLANRLVSRLMPYTGNAIRVGISGVPGVGKSTFIETLGLALVEQGLKVGVLAVDPSSKISGGSILGDKVRMEMLAREPRAFIRPSPSAGSLGGVARRTRETMLLCEAAGFDVLLIETVGVGQSEVTVCEMVDFFLVLLLPNAGDEIQGIKKGIIEMADGLVINKADGDMVTAARQAKRHYQNALHFLHPKNKGWQPKVVAASAAKKQGIDDVWKMVTDHRSFLEKSGLMQRLRSDQTELWFHSSLREDLLDRLYGSPKVSQRITELRAEMLRRETSPHQAAEEIVELFLGVSQSVPTN